MNNIYPERYIFDRKFFKSNEFRCGLEKIVCIILNINIKIASYIVYNLKYLTDEDCITYIKINSINSKYYKEIHYSNISQLMTNLAIHNEEKNKKYLDIGCNDGKTTLEISNELNIDINNTYGVDINTYDNQSIINFMLYNGYQLPLKTNSLDYITVFQILHNANPVFLSILLNEINRVLKIDGRLIIKEYNSDSEEINKLIELENIIININNGEEYKYVKYRSELEWDDLFKEYGLIKIRSFSKNDTPTKKYYSIYTK